MPRPSLNACKSPRRILAPQRPNQAVLFLPYLVSDGASGIGADMPTSQLVAANMSRLTSPDAPHLENLSARYAELDRCSPLDSTLSSTGFILLRANILGTPPSPPSYPARSSSLWTSLPSPPSAALANAQEALSTPCTNTTTSPPTPQPSSAPPSPAAPRIG